MGVVERVEVVVKLEVENEAEVVNVELVWMMEAVVVDCETKLVVNPELVVDEDKPEAVVDRDPVPDELVPEPTVLVRYSGPEVEVGLELDEVSVEAVLVVLVVNFAEVDKKPVVVVNIVDELNPVNVAVVEVPSAACADVDVPKVVDVGDVGDVADNEKEVVA